MSFLEFDFTFNKCATTSDCKITLRTVHRIVCQFLLNSKYVCNWGQPKILCQIIQKSIGMCISFSIRQPESLNSVPLNAYFTENQSKKRFLSLIFHSLTCNWTTSGELRQWFLVCRLEFIYDSKLVQISNSTVRL